MSKRKLISILLILCMVISLIPPLQVSAAELYITYDGRRVDSGGSIHYTGDSVSFRINFGLSGFNLYMNDVLYQWTSNNYMDITLTNPQTSITFRADHNGDIGLITVNFYKNTTIDPGATLAYQSFKVFVTNVNINGSDYYPNREFDYDGIYDTGIDKTQLENYLSSIGATEGTVKAKGYIYVHVFVNGVHVGDYETTNGDKLSGTGPDNLYTGFNWGSVEDELRQRGNWKYSYYFTPPVKGTFTVRHKDIDSAAEIVPAIVETNIALPALRTAQPVSMAGYKSTPDKYIVWYGSEGDANSQTMQNYTGPVSVNLNTTNRDGFIYYFYSKTKPIQPPPEPPAGSPPIMGIDAIPKKVAPGEAYTVKDLSRAVSPSTKIVSWTVKETFTARGTSTETVIQGPKDITNAAEFFKTYTKTQEGTYTYYITKVTDDKGLTVNGQLSVQVEVESLPEPPEPPEEPLLNPPVARISAPDKVWAGSTFMLSDNGSTSPNGNIISYKFQLIQQTPPTGYNIVLMPEDSNKYVLATLMNTGTYLAALTVTDEKGMSASTYKYVEIIPPIPAAAIKITGQLKENRKLTIDASGSTSPAQYPIDWSKTVWEIMPLSGGTAEDIKYNSSLNGNMTKDILIKKAGKYRIKLTVWNSMYSATAEKDIDIREDMPPVADFSVPPKVYRDPGDDNKAAVQFTDMSTAPDADAIGTWTYTFKYDSDNDGDFSDETAQAVENFNISTLTGSLTADKVGRYQITCTVKETFDAGELSAFILPSDYRQSVPVAKTVEVDNQAPTASLTGMTVSKVDLRINEGSLQESDKNFLESSIVNIRTDLRAQSVDADIKLATWNMMYEPDYLKDSADKLNTETWRSDVEKKYFIGVTDNLGTGGMSLSGTLNLKTIPASQSLVKGSIQYAKAYGNNLYVLSADGNSSACTYWLNAINLSTGSMTQTNTGHSYYTDANGYSIGSTINKFGLDTYGIPFIVFNNKPSQYASDRKRQITPTLTF